MIQAKANSSKVIAFVLTVVFALLAGVVAYATWSGGAFQLRSKAASEEAILKQWTFDKDKEGWNAFDWKSASVNDGEYSFTVGERSEQTQREEVCTGQKKNGNYKCKDKDVTRLFDPRIENASDVTLSYPYNRVKMSLSISPGIGLEKYVQGESQQKANTDPSFAKKNPRPKITVRLLYKINDRKNYESPLEISVFADGSLHEVTAEFPRTVALRKITDLRVSFSDLRTFSNWQVAINDITLVGRKEALPPDNSMTFIGKVQGPDSQAKTDVRVAYFLIGRGPIVSTDSDEQAMMKMRGTKYLLVSAPTSECPSGTFCKMMARQIDFSQYSGKIVAITGTVVVPQGRQPLEKTDRIWTEGTPILQVKTIRLFDESKECTQVSPSCLDGSNKSLCKASLPEGGWWCPLDQPQKVTQ